MELLESPNFYSGMLTTWLIIVLSAFSEVVISNPLGLIETARDIRDPEPSYLPEYNGFISFQAFNRTPHPPGNPSENYVSAADSGGLTSNTILITSASTTDVSSNNGDATSLGKAEDHGGTDRPLSGFSPSELTATERGEVEPKDDGVTTDDNSLSTEPRIQVVTKTLVRESTYQSDHSSARNNVQEDQNITTAAVDETVTHLEKNQTQFGETLESGGVGEPVETNGEVDIFDHLMGTIHNHWLEFVGKMKMSVLDVWKSISKHMMERLEDFASAI